MFKQPLLNADILYKLLLLLLVLALLSPLLFPFIFGMKFFLPSTFVAAQIFNILVEFAFLAYFVLLLKDETRYRPFFTCPHILFFAFVISMSVSAIRGIDPQISFWGDGVRSDGVFFMIHLFVFVCLLTWSVKKQSHILLFLKLFVGIGAFIGIAAAFEKLLSAAKDDLLFGNTSALAEVALLILPTTAFFLLRDLRIWRPVLLKARRLFAVSIQYNLLRGSANALASPSKCAGPVLSSLKKNLAKPRGFPFTSVVYLIICILLAITAVGTHSLTARGLIPIITGVFLLYLTIFAKKRKVYFFMLSGYAIIGAWTLFIKIGLNRFLSEGIPSFIYRSHIWTILLKAMPESILTGYGNLSIRFLYDSFYDAWLNYLPHGHVDKAHNIFFEYLAAAGFIGAVLFVLFWGYLLVILFKQLIKRAPVDQTTKNLYILFFFTFITELLYVQFNIHFVQAYIYESFLIGLCLVILPVKKMILPVGRRSAGVLLALFLPLVIVSSAQLIIQPLIINYRINALQSAIHRDSPHFVAISEIIIEKADSIPSRKIAYFKHKERLALVYEELSRREDITDKTREALYTKIKRLYEEILERHPRMSEMYTKLAFNELQLGKKIHPDYKRDTERYLIKALALSPKQGAYAFRLGNFYFNEKNYEKACPLFKMLARESTYPKQADFYAGLCAITEKKVGQATQFILGSIVSTEGESSWKRTPFIPEAIHLLIMEQYLATYGFQDETVPMYQGLLALQPNQFSLHKGLITYYRNNTARENAEQQASKTARLFPEKIPEIDAVINPR